MYKTYISFKLGKTFSNAGSSKENVIDLIIDKAERELKDVIVGFQMNITHKSLHSVHKKKIETK